MRAGVILLLFGDLPCGESVRGGILVDAEGGRGKE